MVTPVGAKSAKIGCPRECSLFLGKIPSVQTLGDNGRFLAPKVDATHVVVTGSGHLRRSSFGQFSFPQGRVPKKGKKGPFLAIFRLFGGKFEEAGVILGVPKIIIGLWGRGILGDQNGAFFVFFGPLWGLAPTGGT